MGSETSDDAQVKRYAREWTTGHHVSFCDTNPDTFDLQFSSGAKLEVFPTDEGDPESEITIHQSDGSYCSFDFRRGWYLS